MKCCEILSRDGSQMRNSRLIVSGILTFCLLISAICNQSQQFYVDASVDDWPMFRHDLNHTGYTESTGPSTNQTLWTYQAGGSPSSSDPAVSGGRLYVGSEADYKVSCLNATTGVFLWSYTTGSFIYSSPAVSGGKVYICCFAPAKIYCLNATTGAFIWSYTPGGVIVRSSPAVSDGKVYIGCYDNKVYCLNADTGASIWNYTTGGFVASSPAVSNGKVYIGSSDHKVYCLNAATGALVWNYTAGDWVMSSPAISDGKVYIGSNDHKVYCLNAATGALVWNYTTGGWVYSPPAVIAGKVYVGSYDCKVYCLNASTGAFIWSYRTGSFVASGPAVSDSKVYLGSGDHKVYCLYAITGAFIWSYTTGNWIGSSPAIAGGRVYIGSEDWKIYAFGPTVRLALSSFESLFVTNGVRVVYPSDSSLKPLGCGAAMVSDWLASMAVSTKLANYTEGLDTNSNLVNQTSGRPIGHPGIGIVSFGGPFVNPIIKYAETNTTLLADRAPVCFYHDLTTGDFTFRHWDGSSIPGASLPSSTINKDKDMFVIETYRDGEGRYMMLCYGFGWKGTYAAGKYFHTIMYPQIRSYDVNWVIVKWDDSNGDGFVNNPGNGDSYAVVASGKDRERTVYVENASDKYQSASSWAKVSDISSWSGTPMKASSSSLNGGCLYGPYITTEFNGTSMLGKSYNVSFRLKVLSNLSASNVTYVDVCCNLGLVLASRLIRGTDFAAPDSWQSFELSFAVPSSLSSGLEFRVINQNHGITDVYTDQIQVRR